MISVKKQPQRATIYNMQVIIILAFSFIIGACLGSFLCCQACRFRRKELDQKPLGHRSVCNHCHYKLKWYDNIPIVSWLILKGKCRKCGKIIGLAELLSELGTGITFVMLAFYVLIVGGYQVFLSCTSYLAGPPLPLIIAMGIVLFVLVLSFIFLAIYDGLYGELPSLCLTFSVICAIIMLTLKEWAILSISSFTPELIYKPLLSFLILGGIYLVLYLISKGRWVGDGDWLLGTAIGLTLFEPWLALVALFLANITACLVMYPIVKSKKNHHIHFGPFLVVAFVITLSFSKFFLSMI